MGRKKGPKNKINKIKGRKGEKRILWGKGRKSPEKKKMEIKRGVEKEKKLRHKTEKKQRTMEKERKTKVKEI